MGVGYEAEPQKPSAWLAGVLAGLSGRLADLEAGTRLTTGRGGTVSAVLSGQTLQTVLQPASGVTIQAGSAVTRRGGIVNVDVEMNVGTAVAQYAALFTLPPGFRLGAGSDYRFGGVAYTTAWTAFGYYLSQADGTVRPLTAQIPAGGIASVHLDFRAGA